MVPETLMAMAEAAERALKDAGLSANEARLACLRSRELGFPLSARLEVRNGSTYQLHLGVDRDLGQYLLRRGADGFEAVCHRFLESLVKRLPTRRPFGEVHMQGGGPVIVTSRGLRSYVLRIDTSHGAFFVVGDLISRIEYEALRDTDFEERTARSYLPRDIRTLEEMADVRAVDNLLLYMRKLECDLQVQIGDDDRQLQLHNGVIWTREDFDDKKGLLVVMDCPTADEFQLERGTPVILHAGIRERHVYAKSVYLGKRVRSASSSIDIECLVFEVPTALCADQRRKAFRIPTSTHIVAEIEPYITPGSLTEEEQVEAEQPSMLAQVIDLSFAGAQLVAPEGQLRQNLEIGDRVFCRMIFAGEDRALEMRAVVRRVDTVPADRNERSDAVGLEFQISGDESRRNLEFIRDYVLSEQRLLLAKRVQVLGSA